jgi:transcriptional regulator with XRE-family HTH domain
MGSVEKFPAQLKQRRKKLCLSLARTARRAGTSAASLSRYENGWSRFEIATLRRLAAALGCRIDVRLVPISPPTGTATTAGFARLKRLFWDHRLVPGDLERHAAWVVGRVCEYGDLTDTRFLAETLGVDRFLALTGDVRFTSARAARFWQHLRDMEGIICAKKRSRPAAETSWRR